MNKNYQIALDYVTVKYPWLFGDHIESITLVPPCEENARWYGLHCYSSVTEKSTISIRDGKGDGYDVIAFIDTIVHELVHAAQYNIGMIDKLAGNGDFKIIIERHADGMAYQAIKQYKIENNIPLWK